ncbi:CDP-alcohol phosphatidyltransferase family protein [Candidatus Woesearchaeota archaeon]|nr:CDP-alcohol phosphatidyltransferase family protein [Candidatus Woesearchaeota archaeon]
MDGYFARKNKQVTQLGKLIDPIADKLLISTALVFLVGKGVPLWMAVAIIAREVIITSIRAYLLPSKIVVPASSFGKAKTVVQSIAIVFVLLNLPLSWHMMFAAVLLTVLSGLEYLMRIRQMTGNKIVNLPNLITLFRFLLIMPFVYYFWSSEIHIALLIFALISLSDKLDGISARLMNQKTEIGSGFDSFTDWTLIITTFILLAIKNYINLFWVVLLVVPSIISGAMKIIYIKRQKTVPVTIVARLSVGMTYTTIISIVINFRYTIYLLLVTVLLVYFAMIGYIFKTLTLPKKPHNKQ